LKNSIHEHELVASQYEEPSAYSILIVISLFLMPPYLDVWDRRPCVNLLWYLTKALISFCCKRILIAILCRTNRSKNISKVRSAVYSYVSDVVCLSVTGQPSLWMFVTFGFCCRGRYQLRKKWATY